MKKTDPFLESNFGKACAEGLIQIYEEFKRCRDAFLVLCDVINRKDPNKYDQDMIDIAQSIDLEVCVWCQRDGSLPSIFFRHKTEFSQNGYDAELGGKVCDECLQTMTTDETKAI